MTHMCAMACIPHISKCYKNNIQKCFVLFLITESRGYVHMSTDALGGQKGASDTLELELQSSSEPPNVLIIELRSSTRGVCASYLQHPLPSMFKESYPVFLSVT